jgi:hypothetical protein
LKSNAISISMSCGETGDPNRWSNLWVHLGVSKSAVNIQQIFWFGSGFLHSLRQIRCNVKQNMFWVTLW